MASNCITLAPLIRRLTIDRFRGIEHLDWFPRAGVNVILGGGDVGKTTILDAIALLLHPTNTTVLSDAHYWRREVKNGFRIEAVMSIPETCGINQQTKNAWPWEWDGKETRLPNIDGDPAAASNADPVYRLRVCGTADFDLAYYYSARRAQEFHGFKPMVPSEPAGLGGPYEYRADHVPQGGTGGIPAPI